MSELLVGTNAGNIFVYDFAIDFEPKIVATALAGRLAYGVAAGDVDGDGQDEFVLTRGKLGYAGMTKKHVVAEVWKLFDGQLNRVWQQETVDLPRPLVHDLNGDDREVIIVYSLHGGQLAILEPSW